MTPLTSASINGSPQKKNTSAPACRWALAVTSFLSFYLRGMPQPSWLFQRAVPLSGGWRLSVCRVLLAGGRIPSSKTSGWRVVPHLPLVSWVSFFSFDFLWVPGAYSERWYQSDEPLLLQARGSLVYLVN